MKITATNMGFSAMLADECILISISLSAAVSDLTNKSQQKNLTSTSVFQSAFVPG